MTLLQASLLASMIAALLAHSPHKQTQSAQEGMARTEAPQHPRRLTLPRAVSCQSMAQACDLDGGRSHAALAADRRVADP
jgi:hypothetical protein